MMSRPNGNPLQIEQPADVLRPPIPEHEGQHADFFAGRADQPQTVDPGELLGRVFNNSCSYRAIFGRPRRLT